MSSTSRFQKTALIAIGIIVALVVLRSAAFRAAKSQWTDAAIDSGSVVWEPVAGAALPDASAFDFDPTGRIGAAVSSEGLLLVTRDGGRNWGREGKAPLGVGEIASAVAVDKDGSIIIGAGVDESPYTALYRREPNGLWKTEAGNYGGIAGGEDGIFVGGGGLVVDLSTDAAAFGRLPECGRLTLYGAARSGGKAIVVGDYGLAAQSEDNGRSWRCMSLSESSAPFYSAALSKKCGLIGGAGALWRLENGDWKREEIESMNSKRVVFALYLSDDGIGFAAGGSESGSEPFILHTSDCGRTWKEEAVKGAKGRAADLARGAGGLFAVAMDGRVLVRRKID